MTVERDEGGCEIARPAGPALRIVFDCPHAGRGSPPDFGSCEPVERLRAAEDAHVDELVAARIEAVVDALVTPRLP